MRQAIVAGAAKIFDDGVAYKRVEIKKRLHGVSDRFLDTFLAKIKRIALTKRTILYRGSDLNALLDQAAA